jgi:ribosome biogenesis GTPase
MTQTNDYIIEEILPRKNYIVRQSPRQKHLKHIIASNIDQAITYRDNF